MSTLSRREFLRVSALAGAGTLAVACAQPAPPAEPTAAPTAAPAVQPTAVPQPAEAPSGYQEAPMLAERVAAGELAPVEERLPENPFVIEGLDGIGNYGGTWRKSFKGQADGGTISHMTNRGLININQDFLIHPYLAAAWEVNDDATEFTFHLRKGLKWSDGVPMTAEDFRYYYEDEIKNRELTIAHPEELASVIEGERIPVEFSAPDDFTFKYVYQQPKALFHYWGGIILNIPASPKHYMSQFHKEYADADALAGMLKDGDYEDWTRLYIDKNVWRVNIERPTHRPWISVNPWTDEFVTAERNAYFWEVDTAGNQLPYIDKVSYRNFADNQVNLLWAVNGEIDCQARHLYSFDNYTILKEGEETGDYKVQMWRKTKIHAMHFNMTTKNERLRNLFSERDFRIAASLCINRDEMRELLYDGYGQNMQYVAWPDDNPLYYPKLAEAYLDYDPDRANELLDGLGLSERDAEGYRLWNDGSGDRVSFTCLSHGVTEAQPKELMLMDYFKGLGMQMNWRGVDRALSIEMHHSNEVEMTSGEADRNLVPLADPQIWIKHKNIEDRPWCNAWTSWYMDPTHPIAEKPPDGHWIWDIWGYWEELQRTVGEEAQKELFWKILDIWAEELPSVGLFGDFPLLVVVKNGFNGIHEGYGWDCCTTVYEYVIDDATWYWDEPEQHTF